MRADFFCPDCGAPVRICLNELGQSVFINPAANRFGLVYILSMTDNRHPSATRTPLVRRAPSHDQIPRGEALRYDQHVCS